MMLKFEDRWNQRIRVHVPTQLRLFPGAVEGQ